MDPHDDLPLRTSDPGLEAAEKAMRSGRSGFIVAAALVTLGAIAALVLVLASGDDTAPYRALGRNLTAEKTRLFDGYWACVLGGVERWPNNTELARLVHRRAEMGGDRFVEIVRDDCLPKLVELDSRLRSLIPPQELRSGLERLITASRDLRGASSDYIAYLETLSHPYDRDEAQDHVRAITRAWYDFKQAYAELNEAIAAKLDE